MGAAMARTVLVAEDDRDIIELLTLYLTGSGYAVLPATDGQEALEVARHNDIDIALVDIMMPQMNGYDFIKEFRRTSSAPVIIISARTQPADKIIGLDAGADGFIAKPFDPLEVCAYIRALLRRADGSAKPSGAQRSAGDTARPSPVRAAPGVPPTVPLAHEELAGSITAAAPAERDARPATSGDPASPAPSATFGDPASPAPTPAAGDPAGPARTASLGDPASPVPSASAPATSGDSPSCLRVNDLVFDTARLVLTRNGAPIALTAAELKIMVAFMGAPGRVFSKTQLYECISGDAYPGSEASVMVHISNIRAKLEDDPLRPRYIKTVRGVGYRLDG